MTVGPKKTLNARTLSVLLMVSRNGRSPVTLVLVSFLSMVVLGLLLPCFKDPFIRQHLPIQLCQKAADKPDIDVVVAVKSSPSNYAFRQAIRNTMASKAVLAVLPWHFIFYMGYSEELARSRELRQEVLKGDLIITPYEDHVQNAVNFFIETIRWVHERCEAKLRYFIHINDSTMLDVVGTYEFLSGMTEEDRYFHCAVAYMVAVNRNVNSSTYVSERQFRDPVFPDFCEGDAFILHARFLKPLVVASKAIPQYPLLGPYVTGHLPVMARVGHKNIEAKIRALNGKPPNPTCTPDERVLFLTDVNRITQWKHLWLKSLLCYPSQSATTNRIAESMVEKMKIKSLK